MQMPILRHENDKYEIGQNIETQRKAKNLSMDKLADLMGTNRNAIMRHEHGENEMSICTFLQYAEALRIEPNELLPYRYNTTEENEKQYIINRILSNISGLPIESLTLIEKMTTNINGVSPSE